MNAITLGNSKDFPGYTDITMEAAELDKSNTNYEFFSVSAIDDETDQISTVGELMWVPSVNRAGICLGGDTQWTDADSPDDAITRYNNDKMAN